MKYSQEEQNQILRKLNAGVIGKRKQGDWDRIAKNTIYTDKEVLEIGSQYNTLGEFQLANVGAYNYAKRYDLFKKMNFESVKREEFTKEQVYKIALTFSNRWDFQQGDNPAYHWAKRNNILDKVCSHMKPQRKTWNKKLVLQEAKKYKTRNS